jgi:bacterioferritin (cytochrome b1)
MPELKPLENFRIKERRTEFLEQELLAELDAIEKEIAKFRKEHDEVDSPVFKRCTSISEKEDKLDNLILKHCAVMTKLRILWTHNILEKSLFYVLYGGVELKITD